MKILADKVRSELMIGYILNTKQKQGNYYTLCVVELDVQFSLTVLLSVGLHYEPDYTNYNCIC